MFLVASSYTFLDAFWDILIIFAWLIFLWIAVTVLIDVFRRHDISGWGKAGWVIFVVVLPWIGVLAYLIVNHTGMAERRYRDAAQARRLRHQVRNDLKDNAEVVLDRVVAHAQRDLHVGAHARHRQVIRETFRCAEVVHR